MIEVLVVVAIIALLAAVLIPSLSRARHSARKMLCMNNMRSLGMGVHLYQTAFRGILPWEGYANRGSFKTTDPLPTSGPQTMIPVINNTEGTGGDPTGKNFPKSDAVYLDLNPGVPGIDTIYSTGGKSDYEKWSLVAGTWIKFSDKKSLVNSSEEINALEALVSGTTVTLFASTDGGIFRLTDTNGWNADFSSTFPASYFITAPAGTQFRGIALVPEPASLGLFAIAATLLLGGRAKQQLPGSTC